MKTAQVWSVPVFAHWAAALIGFVVLAASIGSAGATGEIEPNNRFGNPQFLSASNSSVTGGINEILANPDRELQSQLTSQLVSGFVESDLGSPGDLFVAWIDNDVPKSPTIPNTLLGSFNATGTLIASNDDDSPLGDGTASALLGSINNDGAIRLSVTGSGDTGFSGAHSEQGDFDLFVTLGELDRDFYSYRNLVPGSAFRIDISTSDVLKTLLWLDDSGAPIQTRFDEFPLCIEDFVPSNGVLNIAITGGQDRDANGIPDTVAQNDDDRIGIGTGAYTLLFVPEPSSVALSLTAFAVLTALSHRRRKAY